MKRLRKIAFVILVIIGGIRAAGRGLSRWLESIVDELFGFAGIGLLSYGCWLVYHPAGFIAAGAVLILLMLVGRRRKR